jgi:hypothetical protein
MKYKEALSAVAQTLRVRASNCTSFTSKPEDVAEAEGARRAYTHMADELEYLSDPKTPAHESLAILRRWAEQEAG